MFQRYINYLYFSIYSQGKQIKSFPSLSKIKSSPQTVTKKEYMNHAPSHKAGWLP